MDVSLIIRQRLEEFGLEQRELARAAQVTESYISQLLTRRKAPPAPNRTDIYEKMDRFLKLPRGELARLADVQRKRELKKELAEDPAPLFREVRDLVLRKCAAEKSADLRAIFEKESFGELERLVTQTLLDVVKGVARQELENDHWLHMVAELSHRSYEETRVIVLEFLDTDIFHLSAEHCVSFLDPLIESWSIDLATFALDIVLNHSVVSGHVRRFEFVEKKSDGPARSKSRAFRSSWTTRRSGVTRAMKRSPFSSGSSSTASGRRRSTTTGSYRVSETHSTFSLGNRPVTYHVAQIGEFDGHCYEDQAQDQDPSVRGSGRDPAAGGFGSDARKACTSPTPRRKSPPGARCSPWDPGGSRRAIG